MTGAGRFVEVQATAEQTPFDDQSMATLVQLARTAIGQLIEIQKGILKLS
jgi:ribonuclease PH